MRWSWIKTSRTKEINDQSYPRKTDKIVAASFALAVHNLWEVLAEESEYFSYMQMYFLKRKKSSVQFCKGY